MAIHIQEEVQGQQGHLKEIDESGILMIFDTLQKYQYAFPIKSTVRELLSNGIDSVSEKRVAREILLGQAKVEDYFVDIPGPLYKDSKFDPSYYDLNWLSGSDTVSLHYVVGEMMAKDKVIFRDHGVGLGGKRLEGYFKLAYSTKRLSKLPLGKFGLGAKSPLSVGVSFYTMENRYNGRLFRFNVYSNKVDSIIPPKNENLEDNPFIYFKEGTPEQYKVHYLPTKEKNGVTIIIEAKKHHKQQYIDALRSQMLYFDGIDMKIIDGGTETPISYKANILYEDDLIVMSDQNYYSKPHLLLNKVNYGYIAWDELELEDKNGNIGIKVAPEDVEVNPSRESVLWTEKTKQKVLDRFNEVVTIAEQMIQKELAADDFLQWIKTCYSVYNKYTEKGGIVGRLSKIVDLSRAKFKFNPDPRIIFFSESTLPGMFMRHVEVIMEKDASKVRKRKVHRYEVESLGPRLHLPIYLMDEGERASNLKDKYLFSLHPQGFVTVMKPWETFEQIEKSGASEAELKAFYKDKDKKIDKFAYWDALVKSAGVAKYSEVIVPEDFDGTDKEVDEEIMEDATPEEIEEIQTARLTAAERRKQQGKTLIYPLMKVQGVINREIKYDDGTKEKKQELFASMKLEIPIASINDWDAPEIYYGTEREDELMHFVAMITRDPAHANSSGRAVRKHAPTDAAWLKMKWYRTHKKMIESCNVSTYNAYNMQNFFDTDVMLVKTSQSNLRLYRDFSRIEEFFITIKNKTVITMSNRLIKWNTARIIRERLASCAFLYNFPFNQDFSDMYKTLCDYVAKWYTEIDLNGNIYGVSQETFQDMISHLDKVYQFQQFVVSNGNDMPGIAKLAEELFGNKELRDGMAVDPEIVDIMAEVHDYTQTCGVMLNYIPVLTGYLKVAPSHAYWPGDPRTGKEARIPEELEHEVRMFLQQKGVLDYKSSRQANQELDDTIKKIEELSPVEHGEEVAQEV